MVKQVYLKRAVSAIARAMYLSLRKKQQQQKKKTKTNKPSEIIAFKRKKNHIKRNDLYKSMFTLTTFRINMLATHAVEHKGTFSLVRSP